MIYNIKLNGTSIWDNYQAMEMIDPKLEIELNAAGSLQFTMTPDHLFFDEIKLLIDTVEVYEENDLIWFGRPVELERDIQNRKSCYCEGALAFFNDTVQRPRTQQEYSASTLFSSILSTHNSQAPSSRRFTVGTVDVNTNIVYDNDYVSTMSALGALLDRAGGYFIPRRTNGTNYLDYVSTLPQMTEQTVEFGLNMVRFNRQYSFSDLVTGVLPVGGIPDGGDAPTTIESVNDGSDILLSEAAQTYGAILRTVKYTDITVPAELLTAAQEYLSNQQFDPISIQVSAADLHFLDERKPPFRVGTTVHAVSVPNLLDRHLPLTKMNLQLDRAGKEITLGTEKRRTITDKLKKVEEEEKKTKEIVDSGKIPSGGGGDGWIHKINGTTASTGTVNFIY